MSLSVALNAALSALQVTEQQMGLASNNIANADVAGYTAKTLDTTTRVLGGQGVAVVPTGISSAVDEELVRSIVDANSAAGFADTTNSYYQLLQQYVGQLSASDGSSTTGGTDLSSEISALESDLANLAATPTNGSYKSQVVADFDGLASTLRTLSSQAQQQRASADSDIQSTVKAINNQLSTINDLNAQIRLAKAQGQPTADLQDLRRAAAITLSNDIDISYFVDGAGNLQIYTQSGQTLLDDSAVHPLSYQSAGSVSSQTAYNVGGTGGFSAITLNGVDVTSQIQSGKLKALIDQRDDVLPDVQAALDNLAGSLIAATNTIYNQGTADPPPNSLTGTVAVSASDALAASGTVRIAVLDSTGAVSSYQDLDLSTYSSVAQLLTALNGIGGVSAAIDSNGHLMINASNAADGIAVNEMSSAIGAGGSGFSSYFGLNDLLTGTSATTIAVRPDILATPDSLATGSLDSSATLTAGQTAISAGASDVTASLYDMMSAPRSFVTAGALNPVMSNFVGYAGDIIADVATRYKNADSAATNKDTALATLQTSFSNESGVNTDTETAKLEVLQNQYAAAAKVISVAQSMFQTLVSAVAS